MKDELTQAFKEFYNSYLIETSNGAFQVFQSLTYGDMIISFLLLLIVFIMVLKWFYEVLQ